MKWLFFSFVALFCLCSNQFASAAGPETIAEAAAQVRAVTNPNPQKQSELRAAKAMQIVSDRVSVLNSGWGTFLQTLPIDVWNRFSKWSSFKARAEAVNALRSNSNIDSGEAAWILGGGMCAEHATLVKRILSQAGENVKTLTGTGPHDFPVVNLAPDAVPDIPWTWGKNFIVADSWSGKLVTDPRDVWQESIYFKGGENHVTSFTDKVAMREKLEKFLERGKPWIENGHCPEYKMMVRKFMTIPSSYRPDPSYPPKDICKSPLAVWTGTWHSKEVQDTEKLATGSFSLTFSTEGDKLAIKMWPGGLPLTIDSISGRTIQAHWDLGQEHWRFTLTLNEDEKGITGVWTYQNPYQQQHYTGVMHKAG